MRVISAAVLAAFTFSLSAAPAPAVAQGMGLDLSDEKVEKPAARKKKARGRKARKEAPPPAAPPAPEPPVPAAPPPPPAAEQQKQRRSGKAPFPGLGLDLSDDGESAAPAPVMSFEAISISGKTADRQKLDAARRLFDEERYEEAALGFSGVLADPDAGDQHAEAQYLLAKALYRLELFHSALAVFQRVLDRGENDRFFKPSLEWLFFISHRAVNQTVVLDVIARHAQADWPEKYKAEFRYLLARYNFTRGKALLDAASAVDEDQQGAYRAEAKKSFEETRKLTALVPQASPFWARARYVDGLTLYVTGQFGLALDAFKDVVRATNPRTGQLDDPDLREQAFMQLARIHYEHKQNRYAIFYYDKVPRGGTQWLESLYESAWAHFRLGGYERALGNMITLHSPFFVNEYFPEALILQSVIYYENCRYPEAVGFVKEYTARYEPLRRELDRMLARNIATPDGWYKILDSIQNAAPEDSTNVDRLLGRVLKLALSDKDLEHQNEAIQELAREKQRIGELSPEMHESRLARDLMAALDEQRADLEQKAGFYARRKLEKERAELADLSYRALAIQAEIGTREKEILEASLRGGTGQAELRNYRFSSAVDDEHVYWPYEGEYWRDELGTYQYTLTKGCREK